MTLLLTQTPVGPDLSTVDGWQEWVTSSPPQRPSQPRLRGFRAMSEEDRLEFDLARLAWHADFGLIKTPDVRDAHRLMRQQLLANLFMPPGKPRPGALLDGLPTLGKTTILQHFGRAIELEMRHARELRRVAVAPHDRWVPVVHLTLLGIRRSRASTSSCSGSTATSRRRSTRRTG